jgi:hypothetical protein
MFMFLRIYMHIEFRGYISIKLFKTYQSNLIKFLKCMKVSERMLGTFKTYVNIGIQWLTFHNLD